MPLIHEITKITVSINKFSAIEVSCPFSRKFIAKAEELGGVWVPATARWVLPSSATEELAVVLKEIFNFVSPLLALPIPAQLPTL